MAAEIYPDKERYHKHRNRYNALSYAIAKYPRIERTEKMAFVFVVDLLWYNQTGETLFSDAYLRCSDMPEPVPVQVRASASGGAAGSQDNGETQEKQPLFSEDVMRLFDAVIEALKEEQTESVCRVIHHLSMWKDADVGDVLTTNDLRLDEYGYDMLESFFWYHRAVLAAREIEEDLDIASGDTVPKEMLFLQFRSMESEDEYLNEFIR